MKNQQNETSYRYLLHTISVYAVTRLIYSEEIQNEQSFVYHWSVNVQSTKVCGWASALEYLDHSRVNTLQYIRPRNLNLMTNRNVWTYDTIFRRKFLFLYPRKPQAKPNMYTSLVQSSEAPAPFINVVVALAAAAAWVPFTLQKVKSSKAPLAKS